MTTLDDLRATFEEHAEQAGDGFGLVRAAHAGAARVRRRRRITAAVVAAAAAVVSVAVVPVAVALRSQGSAPVAPAPYRQPGQASVRLDPVSGFHVQALTATVGRQYVSAARLLPDGRLETSTRMDVTVFDPGQFDQGRLAGAEAISTGGHDAWYLADQRPDGLRDPGTLTELPSLPGGLVARLDTSGAWVVVFPTNPENELQGRDDLLRLAAAVQLGPPQDVRVPFRLGALPAGLRTTYTSTYPATGGGVRLAVPGRPAEAWDVAIHVDSAQPPGGPDASSGTTTGLTVAGRPATYQYGQRGVRFGGEPARPAILTMRAGTCQVTVTSNRDLLGPQDVVRLLEAVIFAACTDPATWTVPVR